MRDAERAFIRPMTRRQIDLRLKIDPVVFQMIHMQLTLGISRFTKEDSTSALCPQVFCNTALGLSYPPLSFANHSSGNNSVMAHETRLLSF